MDTILFTESKEPISKQEYIEQFFKDNWEKLQRTTQEGVVKKPMYFNENHTYRNLSHHVQVDLVSPFYSNLRDFHQSWMVTKGFPITEETDIQPTDKIYVDQKDICESLYTQHPNEKLYFFYDFFGEYEEKGAWSDSFDSIMNLYKNDYIEKYKAIQKKICIDVSLHEESGANLYQQIGFALAKVNDLIHFFGKSILSQLIFRFSIGKDFFGEIAKLRAFKNNWLLFAKEYGHEELPFIFAQTSTRNKTTFDVENNLIRTGLESISAIISDVDALYIQTYGNTHPPTPQEAETTLKQGMVLCYESALDFFKDALSGSYFIETLTDELGEKSWEYFKTIEKKGGYKQCLESGWIKEEIETSHEKEVQRYQEKKDKLLGINILQQEHSPTPDTEKGGYIQPKNLQKYYEYT